MSNRKFRSDQYNQCLFKIVVGGNQLVLVDNSIEQVFYRKQSYSQSRPFKQRMVPREDVCIDSTVIRTLGKIHLQIQFAKTRCENAKVIINLRDKFSRAI